MHIDKAKWNQTWAAGLKYEIIYVEEKRDITDQRPIDCGERILAL